MAWMHIYGPAVQAHAAHGRVTAIANILAAVEGETRTWDQLRTDVIGDLLIDGTTPNQPPAARGIQATVATLLNLRFPIHLKSRSRIAAIPVS